MFPDGWWSGTHQNDPRWSRKTSKCLTFRCCPVHTRHLAKLLNRSLPHRVQRLKASHQRLSPRIPNSRNLIQNRPYLAFASQTAVILNCKPMGLILNSGDQTKALWMAVNGNLDILIIEPSCSCLLYTSRRGLWTDRKAHAGTACISGIRKRGNKRWRSYFWMQRRSVMTSILSLIHI